MCADNDITEGLLKHVTILYCYDCETYLQPPETRIKAELESSQLLTFCLDQLNLDEAQVTLLDAYFVWTEPHTRRIKVRLRVQKQVDGEVLEQAYIVEYVVQYQLCDNCSRLQSNLEPWVAAVVQLRQHVPHPQRTFFYLEQCILKHNVAGYFLRTKQVDQGFDFFFSNKNHGVKFVEFVGKVAPIRSRSDKELVSHGMKSNTFNIKYTFYVEISPLCQDDLVCLRPNVAISLRDFGPLVLCTKVSNSLLFMDPNSMKYCSLDADQYWRSPFSSLLSSRRLVEYIVLDINNVETKVNVLGSTYVLADVQVARVSDFGRNDTVYHTKTHLGHLLNPGDYALGYDLSGPNFDGLELDTCRNLVLPEVILVRKSYEMKHKKHGKFHTWKLKNLDMEVDNTARVTVGDLDKVDDDAECKEFLRDLEENPELSFSIYLNRNMKYQSYELASMTNDH